MAPGTLEMFRHSNPRVRREAERFLETIRDPHTKFDPENPNNYDDIFEIKKTIGGGTMKAYDTTRRFYGSLSVGKTRPNLTMSSYLESRT